MAEPVFAVHVEATVYVRGGPDFDRRVREATQRIDPARIRSGYVTCPVKGHVGGVPFEVSYESRCDERTAPNGGADE